MVFGLGGLEPKKNPRPKAEKCLFGPIASPLLRISTVRNNYIYESHDSCMIVRNGGFLLKFTKKT